MSLPFNGGKGGHAEDSRIDFSKELKEDVVFWEEYVVIAKIIGLNWPRKDITKWVECNWGKRTVTKFIAKGFFVVLFEEEEERNRPLIDRNWFIMLHAVYIQPWMPHFYPTPLAVYSEPVWIRLYNLLIEYWSEELWEKIGRTLGTLLETDFDDVEDICKCAHMRIATVKRILERITLVSDLREWSQKVEIDKEIARCPRCGSKFHGEKECKMYVRKTNKKVDKDDMEIRKDSMEIEIVEDGDNKKKEINFGSLKGNINGRSNNTEEDYRGTPIREKGLSDTEFEYEKASDDEPYQIMNWRKLILEASTNRVMLCWGKKKVEGVEEVIDRKERTELRKREVNGSVGGMVGLWNPDKVSVDLISKQENWMHCKVRILQEDLVFSLFNVYGLTKTEEKKRVWKEISDQIRMVDSEKVIVVRDFNALLNNEEKFGGLRMNARVMEDFKDFVTDNKLFDVIPKSGNFTWTNRRANFSRILKRLDRIFTRSFWIRGKFDLESIILPITLLDHFPVQLNCSIPLPKLRNFFCTEEYVYNSIRGLVGITLNTNRHWCDALVLEAFLLPLVDIIEMKEHVVKLLASFIKPYIADTVAEAILSIEEDVRVGILKIYFQFENYLHIDSEDDGESDGDDNEEGEADEDSDDGEEDSVNNEDI
ncbi:hypothetical protein SUGI_0566570 [Cryptomeria japonica]|nr:hypothetical protein SUGI_0566570 [Cryptomeria japonica]